MQDRPNIDELLEAVASFLHEDVMPNTSGRLSFHARVAGNVVEMLRRELEHQEDHLERTWRGLDELLGREEPPASYRARLQAVERRQQELSERIRRGDADEPGPFRDAVVQYLFQLVQDKVTVSNPRLAAGS